MPTTPFISEAHVRAVLDSLLFNSKPETANPLEALLLVDEALIDPDLPPFEQARYFALQQVVVQLIEEGLARQRQVFGLPSPRRDVPLSEALAALSLDARHGSHNLPGWSVLYYRYVCVDLSLTPPALAEALSVNVRSVQRYEAHGIRRLTRRLLEAETAVRHIQRMRRLTTALPQMSPVNLVGRARALEQADSVVDNPPPHRLYITGVSGIGKSVFAQEWLRRQIHADRLDHLLWIDQPRSIQAVRDHLLELLPPESTLSLRACLLTQRVGLVLDGLQHLFGEFDTLYALLNEIDAALVCLIDPIYVPLPLQHSHIPLNDLDESDTLMLVRAALSSQDAVLAPDFVTFIRGMVGGVPGAALLLARSLRFYDQPPAQPALDGIYSAVYAVLNLALKRAWLSFCLLPPGDVEAAALRDLWDDVIGGSDLGDLARAHLIETSLVKERRYLLANAARHFIAARYAVDAEVRYLLRDLVQRLDVRLNAAHRPAALLAAVEHVLALDWLDESHIFRERWLSACWEDGIGQGHHARWRALLEPVLDEAAAPELYIAYAICLRRFSDWTRARQALDWAIFSAGNGGAFAMQARALIELAILYRYQGEYVYSLNALERAKHAALHLGDADLAQMWYLEQAQIAIDRRSPDDAQHFLSNLPETRRVLALHSEAALLLGNFRGASALAERVFALLGSDRSAEARLNTLLGRSSERQGDFEAAYRYFAAALTLFEQGDDTFGLARARCNLGAVALHLGRYPEAYALLSEAERVLVVLGDRVALAVARHNLRLARIHLSR